MSGLDSRPSISEQKRIKEEQEEQENNMDVGNNRRDALKILLEHYEEIDYISATDGSYQDISATAEVISKVDDIYPLSYRINSDSTGSLVAQATDYLYDQIIPSIRKNGAHFHSNENEQFYSILDDLQAKVRGESKGPFGYSKKVESEIRIKEDRVYVGFTIDGREEEWQLTGEFLEEEGEPRDFYQWMLEKAQEADRVSDG